jgi:twitching motility protein PilT
LPPWQEIGVMLQEWIGKAQSLGASDLHLETDTAVIARVRGDLQTVGGVVAGEHLVQAAQDLLGAEGWAQFQARGSADLSVTTSGSRCRASFYQTVRGIAIAIRLLAPAIKDLRACNLHPDFRKLIEAGTGLVIISGPTGCGKSTTLAALIEEINATRARNIVTLESPLEYLLINRRSFIRQREIPTHSPSFEQGIIDALRENPDVLVISEMRTAEVMRLTLNAAETGHLVLATMHSANCAEALSRLCMAFPAEIQPSIRAQLADCLVGASCQRLEFLSAHRLRVPRCEILLPSSGAKGTIRSGNFSQLANVLQSGGDEGMWTFDRYQRWIEQNSDWARPMPAARPAAAAAASGDAAQVKAFTAPGYGPTAKPPPPARPLAAGRPVAATKPAAPATPTPADGVIEVPAEEMGLADLAELARKIVERNP